MPPRPESSNFLGKLRPWHYLLLVFFLTILSYSNTLNSPLVLDDRHSFIETQAVYLPDLSFTSISKVLDTSFGATRFIPELSFAINHMMASGKASYYHITNLLIHLLCLAVLYLFLRQLLSLREAPRSLKIISPEMFVVLVCGLWALSPVQTNAVTYLVQRMTSLSALFYLSTLTFYLHGRQADRRIPTVIYFVASAFCLLLAALSKENAATVPFAILILEGMFISPGLFKRIINKIPWQTWLFLALLALVLSPIVYKVFHKIILEPYTVRHFTIIERLLTQGRVVFWYITLLLLPLPFRMNLDHDFNVSHSLLDPITTLFSLAALMSIFIYAWRKKTTNPLLSFGVFWFFLNLLVESTIVPLELVFEHRLYLPSIGLFVAIMALTDEILLSRANSIETATRHNTITLVTIILFACSSLLTTFRNNDWRDELTIYKDCADKSPHKPRALVNHGLALIRLGRHAEAIPILEKAIIYGKPYYENYYGAATNIIASLAEQGKNAEGRKRGAMYFQKQPEKVDTQGVPAFLHNLAYIYASMGDYKLAIEAIKTSLSLTDNSENSKIIELTTRILTNAYDSPEANDSLDFGENDSKETAIITKLAELLLNNRDYRGAADLLEVLQKSGPSGGKYLELSNRLEFEVSANKTAEAVSDINNHSPYRDDHTYRFSLYSTRFILESYRPLLPLVGKLLKLPQKDSYRTDPFIAFYDIQWRLATASTPTIDISHINDAIRDNPNFPPLLEISQTLFLKAGMKKEALDASRHLLAVYPGHKDWNFLEKNIIRLSREISSQEPDSAAIKH